MKISVIHPSAIPPFSARQIIREAKARGHSANYIRPQELNVIYVNNSRIIIRGKREIKPEIAFIRGMSYPGSIEHFIWMTNIVKILEETETFTINSYSSIMTARDKSLLPLILSKNGLPYPKTIITEDLQKALDVINEYGKVVVKPIIGSLGRGVMLLDNVDVAYTVLKQLLSWNQPILLQEFINKKDNRDIRILVINGEIYAAYYRKARPGLFKTNIAQGATPEPAVLDEELKELSIKTTELLGLFYAGIDIAESEKGERYILEANASPNWKGPLSMGLNPARKLVEEAEKTYKK
ncbi:RimK family alpha-L-glutamate ligase [Fervidicoccus fontis]|uniref:RimK family alpha-L-glutamate ligase n=1 Tax=Fervidicoccus fontis TaxID=683846 RepID=A0A843A8M0_9CREN|nr:RimK family alpha-L-glutamate ligase [Fervidicoccus fontis]MBE9391668.1 RimK family alpha-L-glutamate ligase [Fervidicoccus fontis]